MRPSIRWRLTWWNALGFAIVLAGFALLVYLLLARALVQQTDRSLDAGFPLLEADPALQIDPQGRFTYWIEEFREHQQLYCSVLRTDGSLFAVHPDLDRSAIPSPDNMTNNARGTSDVANQERFRWKVRRIHAGDADYYVVLVASLREVDAQSRRLLFAMLLAGPVAILISAFFAYGLARKALAPVDRLRRSTDDITADRLDQRLPVENPHDELGRLSQTINAMVGRLERSFGEMRRFTADASHELRTPLTAIRTEAEVAINNPLEQAGYQQLLGSILEECTRMTRLTDQLLALAREDAGIANSRTERVDLARLGAEVADALRPLADAKGVCLSTNTNSVAWVEADPGRLRQVLINIVDNAIKYTPGGGKIDVRVETKSSTAIVVVEDTGIGIPPEDLPLVFDRFYRVDKARSREMGGTGLGLSIARSIVTSHGGTIELSSVPGAGTLCTLKLPAV